MKIPDRIQQLADKAGGGYPVEVLQLDSFTLSIAVDTGGLTQDEADELGLWLKSNHDFPFIREIEELMRTR
jgi:hypothetical protein